MSLPMLPVEFGPHWRRFVARMIASGRYTSFQDVVIAALRELENHEAARAKVSTAGDALMTLCGRCGFIRQTRVTHPEADLFRCACPDRYIDSERPDF